MLACQCGPAIVEIAATECGSYGYVVSVADPIDEIHRKPDPKFCQRNFPAAALCSCFDCCRVEYALGHGDAIFG
jgi:hypothetical protein